MVDAKRAASHDALRTFYRLAAVREAEGGDTGAHGGGLGRRSTRR